VGSRLDEWLALVAPERNFTHAAFMDPHPDFYFDRACVSQWRHNHTHVKGDYYKSKPKPDPRPPRRGSFKRKEYCHPESDGACVERHPHYNVIRSWVTGTVASVIEPPRNEENEIPGSIQKLDDAIDAVEEKAAEVLEDVVEAAQDAQEAVLRALGLDDKFKEVSDNTLDEVAPKAGTMVVEDAAEFVPAFKQLDKATPQDLTGAASEGCTDKILSFREKIRDFCDDVVEFLAEGLGAIVSCLYKVVNWIMRACKEGVKFAVDMLKKVIPDCCENACLSCAGLATKLAAWIAKVMNALINMVEDCIKKFLSACGAPDWLIEKVDFNGDNKPDPDKTDDNDEPVKKKKAREAGGEAAPQQETMEEPVV
jgi:hypothetical protein